MNVRSFMKKKDLSAAVKSLQKRFAWICGFYTVCLESSNSTFFFQKKILQPWAMSTTKSLQQLHRIIQGTDDILNRRKFNTNWRVHRTYARKSGRRDGPYVSVGNRRKVLELPEEDKVQTNKLYDLLETMNDTIRQGQRDQDAKRGETEMNVLRDSMQRQTVRAEYMRDEIKDMHRAMSEERDLSEKLRVSIQHVREENERTRDELISIVETLGSEVLNIREEQVFRSSVVVSKSAESQTP